jgi:phosphohistidine phosphatase
VRLHLVQHGLAAPEAEDPDRPLTEQGVADVTQVAQYAVGQLGVGVNRIIHSGKTRARQTAAIWDRVLQCGVLEADGLAPNDDPMIWAERVATETSDLMLVGHLPHLGRLASLLLAGSSESGEVRFRPGALVQLETTDAGWELTLLLPPARA